MKKELFENEIKGKRITVMGLGLLGRGIGDAKFLHKHGAILTVTDKKDDKALATSLESMKSCDQIVYRLGGHSMEDFKSADIVFKSAGVPLDSLYIKEAEKNNIPVYMSAAFVASMVMKHLPLSKVVGITGTRGKSTTTHMIAEGLRAFGKVVHLGGNIRGLSNLPILDVVENGDIVVMELDSWQLQGFASMNISPHVSVFTSFMDDHMNYYKYDRDAYFMDKAAIFYNQTDKDVCFVHPKVMELCEQKHIGHSCVAPTEYIATGLLGEHNEMNAALAYSALIALGVDDKTSKECLLNIKAVEGRLEYMGQVLGAHVYNDNNGTTPDATIAGIHSIINEYGKKPIVITGGADKGLDMSELKAVLSKESSLVVYLSGTGTDTYKHADSVSHETLSECVEEAFANAKAGDIILFSPSCASFSKYFNNEYERNDEFVRLITSKKR